MKGGFRVHPHAEPAEALQAVRTWHLAAGDARRMAPPGPSARALPPALAIRSVRVHGDGLVAQALGIDDRDAAEALRGAAIHLSRADFPPAATDEYYLADLIGAAVVNRAGEDLGRVVGFLDTGPHSVLRLAPAADAGTGPGAGERMVPFVAAYVDSVDVAAGRIVVDWGLDY